MLGPVYRGAIPRIRDNTVHAVLELSGGLGFNPPSGASHPQVFNDPPLFSEEYKADPLWFHRESSTKYMGPTANSHILHI